MRTTEQANKNLDNLSTQPILTSEDTDLIEEMSQDEDQEDNYYNYGEEEIEDEYEEEYDEEEVDTNTDKSISMLGYFTFGMSKILRTIVKNPAKALTYYATFLATPFAAAMQTGNAPFAKRQAIDPTTVPQTNMNFAGYLVNSFNIPSGEGLGVYVNENGVGYLAADTLGLVTFNATDPLTAIEPVNTIATAAPAQSVSPCGPDRLVVGVGLAGVQVFDTASDPYTPTSARVIDTTPFTHDAVCDENFVIYTADNSGGVRAFNRDTGASLGSFATFQALRISYAPSRGILAVGDSNNGLEFLTQVPLSRLSEINLPGQTVRVALSPDGNLAAGITVASGIRVFDITNANNPNFLTTHTTLNFQGGLDVTFGPNGQMYTASGAVWQNIRFDISSNQTEVVAESNAAGGNALFFDPQTNLTYIANPMGLRTIGKDAVPQIVTTNFTIPQGEEITLGSSNIEVVDPDHLNPSEQIIIPSRVEGGEFIGQNDDPVSYFTQQQVNDREIRFRHDGSQLAPRFDLRVTDLIAASMPIVANIVFLLASSTTTTPTPPIMSSSEINVPDLTTTMDIVGMENNELGAILGGVFGGLFLICCCAAVTAAFAIRARQREIAEKLVELEDLQRSARPSVDSNAYHDVAVQEAQLPLLADRYHHLYSDNPLPPTMQTKYNETTKKPSNATGAKKLGEGAHGDLVLAVDKKQRAPFDVQACKVLKSPEGKDFEDAIEETVKQRRINGVKLEYNQRVYKRNHFSIHFSEQENSYILSYLDSQKVEKRLVLNKENKFKDLNQRLGALGPEALSAIFEQKPCQYRLVETEGNLSATLQSIEKNNNPWTYYFIKDPSDLNMPIMKTNSAYRSQALDEIDNKIRLGEIVPGTYIIHEETETEVYYVHDTKERIKIYLKDLSIRENLTEEEVKKVIQTHHHDNLSVEKWHVYRSENNKLVPMNIRNQRALLNALNDQDPDAIKNFVNKYNFRQNFYEENRLLRLITNVIPYEKFLDTRHCMPILDSYHDGKYIHTLYAPYNGETIKALLANSCITPKERELLVVLILNQLCAAVWFMHQDNHIHHDIKLDNMVFFWRSDNDKLLRTVLIDFGETILSLQKMLKENSLQPQDLQRLYDNGHIASRPPEGLRINFQQNPLYTEKLSVDNTVDFFKKRDIFAVGIVALALLTGKSNPFAVQPDHENPKEKSQWNQACIDLKSNATAEYFQTRIEHYLLEVPEKLKPVLSMLLEVNVNNRISNIVKAMRCLQDNYRDFLSNEKEYAELYDKLEKANIADKHIISAPTTKDGATYTNAEDEYHTESAPQKRKSQPATLFSRENHSYQNFNSSSSTNNTNTDSPPLRVHSTEQKHSDPESSENDSEENNHENGKTKSSNGYKLFQPEKPSFDQDTYQNNPPSEDESTDNSNILYH